MEPSSPKHLNVQHRFSGSESSPIGVPSTLQNFKQHQKDRNRVMEKFTNFP